MTAWIALGETGPERGHARGPGTPPPGILHKDTFAENNLLSRAGVSVEVDETKAVTLELEPGQMSLHHVKLIHGSEPDPSTSAGSGSRSIHSDLRARSRRADTGSAMLVRGADAFGNFHPEERPLPSLGRRSRTMRA